MAFKDTYFSCIDNTGVIKVKCIYVYDYASIRAGSVILVTVKKVVPNRKVVKGQKYKAVVVRLKKLTRRWNGVSVNYSKNEIVLLKKNDLVPMGTRILGSVFYELRIKGFMKIVALSSFLV